MTNSNHQSHTVQSILSDLSEEGRICPQPEKWNQLWKMLPNRKQIGVKWEPALPLILAAWNHSSDYEKSQRFKLHLGWADEHESLAQIAAFLNTLQPADWHTRYIH